MIRQTKPKTQKLWCERGKHEWERPAQRGNLPVNCPKHKKVLTDEHKQRMQAGRKHKVGTNRRTKMAAILELASLCHCGFTLDSTDEEIYAKATKSCTDPQFICPVAERMMRRIFDPGHSHGRYGTV